MLKQLIKFIRTQLIHRRCVKKILTSLLLWLLEIRLKSHSFNLRLNPGRESCSKVTESQLKSHQAACRCHRIGTSCCCTCEGLRTLRLKFKRQAKLNHHKSPCTRTLKSASLQSLARLAFSINVTRSFSSFRA